MTSTVLFSSQDALASGQLTRPFSNMSLDSQRTSQDSRSRSSSQRGLLPSQVPGADFMPTCSQVEGLGTQDYITPVDQAEGGPVVDPRLARSPAPMSPMRMKRARHVGNGFASPPPHPSAAPRLVRLRSPPCYRCIFRDADSESSNAEWRTRRDASTYPTSRMRLDFKELGVLGQGSFSRVFRVRHRLDGREYALKRSLKEVAPDSTDYAQFLQEVQVLAHVPAHPSVVGYHGAWVEPGTVPQLVHTFVLLERCEIGLSTHVRMSQERLTPCEVVALLRALCSALVHLHAHGVAHMDVKPDNVYLACGGGERDGQAQAYKLGDFGQASLFGAGTAAPHGVQEGDSRYLAPELLDNRLDNLPAADMFSVGATLLELVRGEALPASGAPYTDLRRGRLPLLPHVPAPLARLIRQLMSPDPEDRPTAAQVLAAAILQPDSAAPKPRSSPSYGGLVFQKTSSA